MLWLAQVLTNFYSSIAAAVVVVVVIVVVVGGGGVIVLVKDRTDHNPGPHHEVRGTPPDEQALLHYFTTILQHYLTISRFHDSTPRYSCSRTGPTYYIMRYTLPDVASSRRPYCTTIYYTTSHFTVAYSLPFALSRAGPGQLGLPRGGRAPGERSLHECADEALWLRALQPGEREHAGAYLLMILTIH